MQFKVKVKVMAEVDYEVTVDAVSEDAAESEACRNYQSKLPSDFQVERGYVTELVCDDTTQLSWECQECGFEIPEAEYTKHDEMCTVCFAAADVVAAA